MCTAICALGIRNADHVVRKLCPYSYVVLVLHVGAPPLRWESSLICKLLPPLSGKSGSAPGFSMTDGQVLAFFFPENQGGPTTTTTTTSGAWTGFRGLGFQHWLSDPRRCQGFGRSRTSYHITLLVAVVPADPGLFRSHYGSRTKALNDPRLVTRIRNRGQCVI